jgi:hypothetical protein
MGMGDVNTAFQANVAYGVNYFYSGLPLEPCLQDIEKYCTQFLEYNNELFFLLGSPLWQCLLVLTGNSRDMETGDIIDRRNGFKNPNHIGQQSLWSYSMQIAFYLGELDKATSMAEKLSQASVGIMRSSFFHSCRTFFFALIAIANYRFSRKRKHKLQAERYLKFFRQRVQHGAINLVHKLQLLEAEMMNLSCHNNSECDAMFRKYDDAVVSATRAGFLQDAALANYLCFQFCQRKNVRCDLSEMYLKKSYELWISWGATAVADSLMNRHSDLPKAASAGQLPKDASSSSHRGRTRFDPSLSLQHKHLTV